MKRVLASLICIATVGSAFAQMDVIRTIQGATGPVRIPVRSADPWMIKMMLEGVEVRQPEYSTIQGNQFFGGGQFGGFGGGAGGFGGGAAGGGGMNFGGAAGGPAGPGGAAGGGMGAPGGAAGGGAQQGRGLLPPGGRLVVNPTDNSLWWMPERAQ
jgi:hypothetical protein